MRKRLSAAKQRVKRHYEYLAGMYWTLLHHEEVTRQMNDYGEHIIAAMRALQGKDSEQPPHIED